MFLSQAYIRKGTKVVELSDAVRFLIIVQPPARRKRKERLTGMVTMPSNQCPPPTVSTASAIKSLDWSE
jgi:hypothetical protein